MSSNPTTSVPYLSVVATARNDNHGGNLILRMQLFISGLIEQCNRHGVETELILVEWNPPPDKPRLAEVLSWPADSGKCQVRIVEVPVEVHSQLDHAERLPLFQMIGKNVGIRRARGKFVLATNIDILFSDAVFEYLKSGRMQPGYIYRANRFDVPSEVPHEKSLDEQLQFCREKVMREHYHEGSYDNRLRKWVSMRIDVKSNLRGRLFALRWKAVVAWRTAKNMLFYRSRHYRHQIINRIRWVYDRIRDRVRWFNHEVRQFFRRIFHTLRNRSRWLLHRVRDRVRWVVHRCRDTARRVLYPFRQAYRICKHTLVNRSRWLIHRIMDRVRWVMHNLRNLMRRVVHLLMQIPSACGHLLIGLLLIPFFILRVIVFAYRKADRRIRLSRGLPAPDPIRFDERNAAWLKHKIVNSYALNYVQSATRVVPAHYRRVARARMRYAAMRVRDALPQWFEDKGFVPVRVDLETREERKEALREHIEFLRAIKLSPRIGRAAYRRIRNKKRWQLELVHFRVRMRQMRQRNKLINKQQRERQIRSERIEKKRKRKFEARRQESLERRKRRAAVESKRRVQKRVPRQHANGKHVSSGGLSAAQGNPTVHRMNGSGPGPRNESQQSNGLQRPDARPIAEIVPITIGPDRLSDHDFNGAAHSLATYAPSTTDVRANGEQTSIHVEPAIAQAEPQTSTPQPEAAAAAPQAEAPSKASKQKRRLQWPNMHTNGCGDFTMLAYEDWAALRGYPEFQMYSMHIDSLFMLAAGHHGLAQQLLPKDATIYHIEHGIGSGWTPEGNDKLNKRLSDAGIPQISHDQCTTYDESMAAKGCAEMFNDEDWGFRDITLPETTIHQQPHP